MSYVITVYNKAPCIPELIKSLQNQSGNFEREYIFVNDGSTDNSLDVLRESCKALPNALVISQSNKGPSAAINFGLKHATKEWVYLGDGDDSVEPTAVATLLECAMKYDSLVCKGMHLNNRSDENIFDGSVSIYDDAMRKAMQFYPIGACSLINRSLLTKVGGCDERVFIQDYSISLRVAPYSKFVIINKAISYNINGHQQRLSSNKVQENYDTALARYLYIHDNMDLAYQYKYIAFERQLKKSWSWYRKQKIIPRIFSKYFIRYILTRFDASYSNETIEQWMKESLEVYDTSKVRRGGDWGGYSATPSSPSSV